MANEGVITKIFELEVGEIVNDDPYPMYFKGFQDIFSRPSIGNNRSIQIILPDGSGSVDVLTVKVYATNLEVEAVVATLDALAAIEWSDVSSEILGAASISNGAGVVSLMRFVGKEKPARWYKITVERTAGSANNAYAKVRVVDQLV